jgi:hypothetical protein
MITNYIPCFLKEDICEHYLSRRISNDWNNWNKFKWTN